MIPIRNSMFPVLAAALLAGCAQIPQGAATGDVAQDPDIAVNAARHDLAQAEALPLLQQRACGPFRVEIRTPRTAPGPAGPQPHFTMVIHQPQEFDDGVRFTRDNRPFEDARILYRAPSGWQDVTSFATALALGASRPVVIEPEPGASTVPVPRHAVQILGSDPARHPNLVLDGKFSMAEIWAVDPRPGESLPGDPMARARAGDYRIRTGAQYGLAWAGGECGFTLPDLPWRVPG